MTLKEAHLLQQLTTTKKIFVFVGILFLCFTVGFTSKSFLPFNPASAVAISCLLIFGNRYALAIFLATAFTQWTAGTPHLGILGISIGSTLEAIIGEKIISTLLRKTSFKNYNEFIAIIIGLAIAAIFRATVGVFTLFLVDKISIDLIFHSISAWWSGSFIAGIIIIPLFLEAVRIVNEQNWREYFVFNKLMIFTLINIFGILSIAFVFTNNSNQAYVWMWCLSLLFSGLFLGHIYARLMCVILSFTLIILSVKGFGSFDYGIRHFNIYYIYIILFSFALSAIVAKPLKSEFTDNKYFVFSMLISWSVICTIIYFTSSNERENINRDLNTRIEKTVDRIKESMADAEDLLLNASGLIIAAPKITLNEWKVYIDSHLNSKNFYIVNGLGVIRANGKENSLPISLYASAHPTQIVPGLDLGADNTLLKGANSAKQQGHIFASETTMLMHEKELHNSFILFHPIITSDNSKAFQGWIFAPVITEHFFNKALEPYKEYLYINIKEGPNNIYSSQKLGNDYIKKSIFEITRPVEIYGNTWTFSFYPRNDFFIRHSSFVIPVTGMVISIYLLVACFVVELFSFGIRAEKLVEERTQEIIETRTQLIQATKMASLGDMASGMAHEINNPLTVINGRLQMLIGKTSDLKTQADLEKMLIQTEKIAQIISGLRKFSGTKETKVLESASINKLINNAVSLCKSAISDNNIDLKVDFTIDYQVNCHPQQISQVIYHLIRNSCDAISTFDDKWILIKTTKTDRNSIQIIVTDSGRGIPDEIADKIMQPFFTTKEVGVGKGMDLSVSLGIMREHNGSLTLDRKASNTTFIIEFPA
jgi:signal transduction histidine kinase/MFS family permease